MQVGVSSTMAFSASHLGQSFARCREGSNLDLIRVNLLQLLNAIRVEETIPTRMSDSFGGGGLLQP